MRVPGSASFPSFRRGADRGPSRALRAAVTAAVAAALLLPASVPAAALASATAGSGSASSGSGPILGQDAHHDVSPPLRDLVPQPTSDKSHGIPLDLLADRPTHTAGPGTHVTDPVVQSTSGAAAAPSTIANFDGVNNLDGVYPPDTNGDVGPNDYVQWVNLHFAIYSKTGTLLYGPAAGNTLWSGFGAPCATQNSGDPIALYDSMADRWIMAQFTSNSPYGECVAVSTTGDPTGSWYRYFFQFSTTVFYDYPKLGVWPDGYYLTANRFGTFFQGASTIVLDRSKMLTGQAATFQEFQTGTSFGTLIPADLDGSTLPVAGSPETVAEISSGALHLWKLHVDFTTPSNSTFTGPTSLAVAAYNQLCPNSRNCVPQPNTTVGLDGLGDRLMYRLAYRNFGDHESFVIDHAVNVASSGVHAGVRWYEIRQVNGVPSLYQQGTYAPDAANRWMGAMAMDKAGNIAIGYSVSSSSIFPSIRYTGRLAGDPLGQLTQGESTLIAGSGSQTGTANRWGDYSMLAVDPVDGCTFWYTNEYLTSTGAAPWRTRIGSFQLPNCASPATAPAAPVLSGSASSGQVSLSWTTPANGGSAITGYNVYRGTSPGGETPYQTLGVQNSYSDTGVTNGTTYYYEVTAVNAVAESAKSNEVFETPQLVAPGAPTGLTATAGNATVSLSWTAPVGSTVTGYNVYRGTSPGGETPYQTLGVQTSYSDVNVTNGTTYYYEVTAVNSGLESSKSNEANATPQASTATVPSAPQNLTAATASGKGVQLNWAAPSSNGGSAITGYQVWRSTSTGTETLLTTLGVVLSYKDTSTVRRQTYFYKVVAVNAIGAGPPSTEASAIAK